MATFAVVVLVAAAVFLVSWVGCGIVAAAAARLRQRYVVRSWSDLKDLLLFIDGRALAVLGFCASSILVGFGLLVAGPMVSVLLGIGGFLAPWGIVHRYRSRRIGAFDRQLVDTLQGLANALRAGLNLQQALESLAREAPAPMCQELGFVVKELKVGVPLEAALTNLGARVASDELALTVASTNTARQLGGNMAEMFETIAGTIRERFRLEGKIDALTSQGKLQGWVVAALPLALGATMHHLRPDLVDPMLAHPFGWGLVGLVIVMEAVGLFFIRRIVRIDV